MANTSNFIIMTLLLLQMYATTVRTSDVWNSVEEICTKQRYSRKVERTGCKTQEFVVNACIGICRSFDEPLSDIPYFKARCQSCQATERKMETFFLEHCDNENDRKVNIESAVVCECSQSKSCA